MSLKQMPLKTLKALIECQYTYCVLCSISYSQTDGEPVKNLIGQAGALAGEQLDTLLGEYKRRKGEDKGTKLIDTISATLNGNTQPAPQEDTPTNVEA